MIRVRALTKRYGDFTAVSQLSFHVDGGEILGLVGPNGAGKTTTLRCVTGIIPPSGGTVEIAGHSLTDEPVEAKRAMAFVPDDPHFFEHLTVEEHLSFVARLYGVEDVADRAPALLRELELLDRRTKLPSELSRGMRQKLGIACALLHEPRLLLFDEPLTGLDPGAMKRMKTRLKRLAADGTAVLLSSHLLHLVEELATRVLVLAEGRAVAEGPISEIAASRPELTGLGLEDVFLALTENARGDRTGEGDEPAGR